jgi:hypothetical protein
MEKIMSLSDFLWIKYTEKITQVLVFDLGLQKKNNIL